MSRRGEHPRAGATMDAPVANCRDGSELPRTREVAS